MSSTYRILCLSHDPALVLQYEWQSGANGRAAAEAAGANPEAYEATSDHATCELMIGCWSGGLTDIGCPASERRENRLMNCYHPHTAQWMDVAWLRLAALAQHGQGEVAAAALRLPNCWRTHRLDRLRHLLGVSAEAAAAKAAYLEQNGERRALHQADSSVLTVDAGNGPEQWTGAEWNAYVDQAERSGGQIIARVVHIDLRGEVPPSNT